MNSIQELAQWVVENRCDTKGKGFSDLEMYNKIVTEFPLISQKKSNECIQKCEWLDLVDKTAICKICGQKSPF